MARKPGSRSDITGPRLREVALRLFARDGYAAVSMRQIAAEVGVQAGALYLYTADKQSLLRDLMDTHLQALLAAWEAEADLDGGGGDAPIDARARLEHFARFHLRFHAGRADEIFLAYNELRNLTPANFAHVEALRRRYETALETILREGQESGALQVEDPKVAAMAIIAMLTGLSTWFREGGRLSRSEVEAIYTTMVLRAAGAQV